MFVLTGHDRWFIHGVLQEALVEGGQLPRGQVAVEGRPNGEEQDA